MDSTEKVDNSIDKREMLNDVDQLKALFEKYPSGTFDLLLRNYNQIESISVVGINDIPKGRYGGTRAYVRYNDIRIFIPLEVAEKLEKEQREKNGVSIKFFRNLGQEMANLMNRKVKITHQYGSGKPEQAEYKTYTFEPQK